jgi:hypothetical protein
MSSPCRALPPGPDLVQNGARTAEIGQRRRTSAAGTGFRRPSAAPSLALDASRPIRSRRSGLDRRWIGSEPRDHDPTDQIHVYRFGLIVNPSRRIQSRRARLDPSQIRSEPLDPDLTVPVRRYRFGLAFLLKSPWVFLNPTRGPAPFKSICRSAQFLAFRPLSFLSFAIVCMYVHVWTMFCCCDHE